jgi:HK97 family phage major capsid protein/HK97 family phage prohead protease
MADHQRTIEDVRREMVGKPQYRDLTIDRADAQAMADDRTVELSFASDTPCPHFSWRLWDFVDVKLSMDPAAMRTDRLANGAALLADHDPTDQIGVVESFSVSPEDGKVRAKVRFSRSARGQEIYQDVIDGIRRNVSVGFSIHKLVLEEENQDGNDLYRADDWEPFEISIVSIPADVSVGVGRSAEFANTNPTPEFKQMSKEMEMPETPAVETEAAARTNQEEKTVRDIKNYIAFGDTYGFGNEVREAALRNPDFNMDDTRMLVQDLRSKKQEIEKRVSPASVIETGSDTLGNALVRSPEYQAIVPRSNQKHNIRVQTNILPSQLIRSAYSGSGDGLTSYDRVPGIFELGQQQPTVADLFMQAQTDSPTIRYMKETTYTNSADTVLEGDDKPEAGFALEETDVSVRKVAVWTKVTDETLEDFAQVRPYIDQRLAFMVRSKIDDQLLNGSGTAPNIAGLLGTSGVQTAEMASNTALEFAKACMQAITNVRTVGFFEPDAIVMHPNDYQKLRLAVDGNSQFYGGGFFQGQYGTGYNDPNYLWGVRVVQTTRIAELDLATPGASNKGPIVGAFKLGGAVFYRNGLSIESTNTDQDDFLMNLTTIRVEQRLALAIYRPLAFCRVINAS